MNLGTSFRNGLYRARQVIGQSDLLVISDKIVAIDAAFDSVTRHRSLLQGYISKHEAYKLSLCPVEVEEDAPTVVKLAANFAKSANVGPMAAIPGALADLALKKMLGLGVKVCVVDNGGEIAVMSDRPIRVGVYAGPSPLSGRIGFMLPPMELPLGIATSSATVGHALSLGEADAVVVFADSASLADAVATAVCNTVKGDDIVASIRLGLDFAKSISGVKSSFIFCNEYVGSIGKIPRLLRLDEDVGMVLKSSVDLMRLSS